MRSRSLKAIALSLLLAGSLNLQPSGPAWAKKADKTSPKKTEATAKPASPRHAAEPAKPSLDAATLQAIQQTGQKLDPATRISLNKMAEAVHLEDRSVNNELRDDEEGAVAEIGMLWEAAVERSGTIRYAIEKLSRRDATGKPVEGDNFSKRMLQSLVHLGGAAGSLWTQSPTAMLGSGMVNDLMRGNPQQDPALARITDADMVILAKEVESLQTQLVELYYGYRHAKERMNLAEEASSNIAKYYDHASTLQDATSQTLQPLMQSIYDSSRQDIANAEQSLASAKTALALVVGPDAVAALDQGKAKDSQANIP